MLLCTLSCQIEFDSGKDVIDKEYYSLDDDEPSQAEKQKRWKAGFAFVTKVIDGDTFWVDNGTEPFKVRLVGVDAPETRNSRYKKKGHYATESKEYVRSKVERRWVRLEFDVQATDRYRRTLAYAYLEGNIFLNASLIEHGYAVVDTHPPNVKHVELFTELQKQAREQERGLWSVSCDTE